MTNEQFNRLIEREREHIISLNSYREFLIGKAGAYDPKTAIKDMEDFDLADCTLYGWTEIANKNLTYEFILEMVYVLLDEKEDFYSKFKRLIK